MIGERTAEDLKIKVGTAYPREQEVFMEVKGRNLVTGLPKKLNIGSKEMMEALEEPITAIADAVHAVFERTPPELASDIGEQGIYMTGGGALLHNLNKLIFHKTGIKVIIADDAPSCVAIGTGMSLDWIDILENGSTGEMERERFF